jgi:hypothetical protein
VVESELDANRVGETNVEMMAAEKGNTIELKQELNQQQRHELGHKLNTTDSETELCKRLKQSRKGIKFFGFLWTLR